MPVNLFTLYSMLFSYYCGFLCFVIVMNILNACCRCSACSSLCFYYLWDVHKMNLGENLSILLDNVLHTVFFDLLEMIFLARFGVCAFFVAVHSSCSRTCFCPVHITLSLKEHGVPTNK